MKFAILSDIHDNAHNLVKALDEITKNKEIQKIIFLGDLAGAAIAGLFSSCPIPVFAIWGNNDGDKCLITKFAAEKDSSLEVGFETFDIITLDKRRIFLTHFPLLAKPMCKSGEFDAVFYGHNHEKHKEIIGSTLLLNPGEIGAYKTGIATYAIYDSEINDANIIEIKDSITTNTETAEAKFKEIVYKFNKQKGHKL